ncbi:MAG: L,D-transpeptidase [Myxococcales bacterium]|nr:L,D-transpeptidase [Myxococcales bacterium]
MRATPTLCCVLALLGCDAAKQPAPGASLLAAPAATTAAEQPPPHSAPSANSLGEQQARAALDRDFPLRGRVTGTQLRVREQPEPEAMVLGWVRVGAALRLGGAPVKTPTCNSGWYSLHPRGFVCIGEGIELVPAGQARENTAIPAGPADPEDATESALPYRYYFVKEPRVPEYHRLPGRADQRRAQAFVERYFELAKKSEKRAERFWAGELADELERPAVVRRFLDRGFFVAAAGFEEREGRRFVRTVRGSYVQQARLLERTGSDFRGVELDEQRSLPLAWAVREAQPFEVKRRDDGSLRMVADEAHPPFARLALVPWAGYERVDTRTFHRLEDGRYLKHWFLAVAEAVARPKGVGPEERWVHVNLGSQTMVLYDGDRPVYATLVSSGLSEHPTPTGLFEIRRKLLTATMSDLGPEAGDDRYSIDDVPYAQYFEGSVALHGAFWHERFGLQRSHGCVNLAPHDARRAFEHTQPQLPSAWHGVSTDKTGFTSSKVYVTEK